MFKEASLLSGIDSAFIGSMQSPLDGVIERAKEHLLRLQNQEGYWVFELEADCTIPSQATSRKANQFKEHPISNRFF